MIRCTWWLSPFDASRAERWDAAWGPEATVAALCPAALRGLPDLRVLRNGDLVAPADYGRVLGPGDSVEFGLDPGAAPFAVGAALGGQSSLLGFGFVLGEFATSTAAFLAVTANLSFALGITALLGSLTKQKPPKPGDQDSPTYGFGGIQSNPAFAGAAFPLVYGNPRVVGPIINIYTVALAEADEYLYMLILVAGHQVEAIGDKTEDGGPFSSEADDLPEGLQINGQAASNFKDIECHVRMGSANQTLIEGFASPVLQESVDRELREPDNPPTGGAEVTPGVYAVGDDEIEAWDTEVSVTSGTEANAFNAVIRFPGGLFDTNSDAEFTNRTVRFQARYRRATNGIPVGAFVVLPAFEITANKNKPFSINYARDFIDPETYFEPDIGHYLDLTPSSTARATSGATTLVTQVAADTEMTLLCWIKPVAITSAALPFNLIRYLGGNRGWAFGIEQDSITFSGAIASVRFSLTMGNGTTTTEIEDEGDAHLFQSLSNPPDGTHDFTMIACTYKASVYEDGDGEVRFFCNGVQVGKKRTSFAAIWPVTQQVIVGAATAGGATNFDGGIDEVLIYGRALSQIEISQKWNGGFAPPPASASEDGILAGWHLDTTITGSQTDDFVGSLNLTLLGSAVITDSSGAEYGAVMDDAEGTLLKDRYLIEIQRITASEVTSFGQDRAEWRALQLTSYDEFEYPGMALLAVKMRASDQLSGGQPLVTVPVKGSKVPSWDGVDPVQPAITHTWSRNPAWVLAHAATDKKLGLGLYWNLSDIDWQDFLDFAEFCDELVPANSDLGDESQPVFDPPSALDAVESYTFGTISPGGQHPLWTDGIIVARVSAEDYPEHWPPETTVDATEEDAEWFFSLTGAGLSASGVPAWLSALEDVPLAMSLCTFSSVLGGSHFILYLYPPTPVLTDDGHNPGTGDDIRVQRHERRMEFDGVFDRTDFPGWEGLLTIAKSARGAPVKRGSDLSVFFDAPRDVDNMLTMGNTIAGTFATTYAGIANRYNVIEAVYLDRARNYERVPITLEHPNVSDPTVLSARRVTEESFEGTSRRSQVYRHLKYKLNVNHVARRMIECRAGPDMLALLPGARIAVSHDVPGWSTSGRIRQTSADSGEVYLDQDVVLLSGTTYQVAVRNNANSDREVRTINSGTGSYASGTALSVSVDFSFVPEEGAVYSFGQTNKIAMDFAVIDTELDDATLSKSIKAIQYNEDVYADAWAEYPATIVSTLVPPEA